MHVICWCKPVEIYIIYNYTVYDADVVSTTL